MKDIVIIGYSGHAYVVIETLNRMNRSVIGYFDTNEKEKNPYNLSYFGSEVEEKNLSEFKSKEFFVGIGNNLRRQMVFNKMVNKFGYSIPMNVIDPSAVISSTASFKNGVLVASNVAVNALADIGQGVILNTSSVIEHECIIGDFSHIAPGAVLAGNVTIGDRSFVGANSVIREGTKVGKDVVIGAGAVVTKDVPDGITIIGNPWRKLR